MEKHETNKKLLELANTERDTSVLRKDPRNDCALALGRSLEGKGDRRRTEQLGVEWGRERGGERGMAFLGKSWKCSPGQRKTVRTCSELMSSGTERVKIKMKM